MNLVTDRSGKSGRYLCVLVHGPLQIGNRGKEEINGYHRLRCLELVSPASMKGPCWEYVNKPSTSRTTDNVRIAVIYQLPMEDRVSQLGALSS